MVDFHFKGLQITKVKINCYFLDQVNNFYILIFVCNGGVVAPDTGSGMVEQLLRDS